jgi:4'-phosphopantetheinyl transferase
MHTALIAEWIEGPARPLASAGRLDVWRIRLSDPSDNENARMRDHAAGAMRQILAGYLGTTAERLSIQRRPGGKPYLTGIDTPLEFNLSHSGPLALLAVSADGAVGVDVEALRPLYDPLRLARRVMDAAAVRMLEAMDDSDARLRLFIDLWTRLEARQKSHGRGIFEPAVAPGAVQTFGFPVDVGATGCVALANPGPAPPALRFLDLAWS